MSKNSDAEMYINNVEFSACRTTHTPQHSNTAQQYSTAQPFTRVCLEFLTTLTFRALHGNHIVMVISPFTRACSCLEFLTTLTFRALHGNHIVSIPFQTIVKKSDLKDFVLR